MAGADRQIAIDLLARDKSERATRSFARNMDKAADAVVVAGKATEKLGRSSDTATRRVEGLDAQIKTVKQNLVFLHQAMGDAADDAERLDISKGIRKAEADIRRLTKSRDALKDLLPDAEPAARSFITKLGSGLASGTAGLAAKVGGSAGPAIGIAIAAAAAPVIAGTISTTLASGAAAGVIGAGIALAVKGDPKLAAAGKLAGTQFVDGLAQTAKNALGYQIPLIFGNLAAAGGRLTTKLGKAFTQLSPYIKPFVKDVTAAVEAVGGSLIGAAGRSGPALMALGKSIRIVGDGFAESVNIIANGGPEMAQNIVLVSGAIADLMKVTAASIRTTALFADAIGGVPLALLKRHYNELAKEQQAVADAAPPATDGIADVGDAAAKAAPEIQSGADALKEFATNSQSMWDSTTRAAKAVDEVNKAFKENGKTLSENTTKGRANRDALSELASAYNATYENSLKVNGEGPKTEAIATNNAKNFVILAQRLGASKEEAEKLADKLLAIPDVKRRVTIVGVPAALAAAKLVKDTLSAIKSRTVRVNVITSTGKNSSELRGAYNKQKGGADEFRAMGGPVRAGEAYVVGDGGRPEVFVPDRNGKIIPSIEQYARSGGSMAGARSAGGGPVAVAVTVRVAGSSDGYLAELINRLWQDGRLRFEVA